MLNTVHLMGRLTHTPEFRQKDDYKLCTFSIAVQRDFKNADGEQDTDFFRIIAWGSLADFIAKYFDKGQPIVIEGALRNRTYTDKNNIKRYVTEIVASKAYFAGGNAADSKNTETTNGAVNPEAESENGLSNSEAYKELCDELNNDDYPF